MTEVEAIETRNPAALDEEKQFELSLRPTRLAEYIGQRKATDNLKIFIRAAMNRREALDHVLLMGPPGLGKCITADSLILTSRGLVAFRELIPDGMKPDTSQPLEVCIYGVNGLEMTSHVYASGYVPTRRIQTRSGFTLEGTPHHPVLAATPEGLQWKQLAQLTTDDYVAIGRGMNIWGEPHAAQWRDEGSPHRRRRSEAIVTNLYFNLTNMLERAPATVEPRAAYAHLGMAKQNNVAPQVTAQRLGLALTDGGKVPTAWRDLNSRHPHFTLRALQDETRTIRLDADFAYLLGALVSDGHIEKGASFPAFVINCEEAEMQAELRRISFKHFGKAPRPRKYRTQATALRFSQSQGRVCLEFGIKAAKARERTIPTAILTSPREAACGFLQGLFDANGCARKDGIEFGTRSARLAQEVQLLLANLGIIAHRREKKVKGESFWQLFIGGRNAELFYQTVGFRLARKQACAAFLQMTPRGWQRSDQVPFANALLLSLLRKSPPHARAVHKIFDHVKRDNRTPTRRQIARYLSLLSEPMRDTVEYQTLKSLTNPLIYWDRVETIDESAAEAFDFVVPETHSFVANGFFNHNTTLANIIANEMNAKLHSTSGPAIEIKGDLAGILTNVQEGDVLFIDEIHRLNPAVEEVLYPAMEDYQFDLLIGQGTAARSIKLELPKFTLIGATTRPGLITAPMRGRFGITFHLDFYTHKDLQTIIERSADILKVEIDAEGAHEIARRSRGTPRIANRLLRRVRDFAEVEYDGRITREVAQNALDRMEVDTFGLDEVDRKLLLTIIEKFGGGPVGLGTISASIHEEKDSIEEIIEPYLIQIGFLNRTPRGRMATRLAYEHFGVPLNPPAQPQGLFGSE